MNPITTYTEAVEGALDAVYQTLDPNAPLAITPENAQAAINAATLTLIQELCGDVDTGIKRVNSDVVAAIQDQGYRLGRNQLRTEIMERVKGLKND